MVNRIKFKHPKKMQVIEFSLYINTLIASFFKLFISYYIKPSKAIFIINYICELIIIISASFSFFFKYIIGYFIVIYCVIGVVSIPLILVIELIALTSTSNSNFTGPSIIITIFGDFSSAFYFVFCIFSYNENYEDNV